MNLAYSDEQRLLNESANALLAARAQKKDARDLWTEMADLGWLGLPVPEAHGGLGQTAVDVAIVTEAFGRHLVSTGYVPAVVLGGAIVASAASDAQQAEFLPALAEGRMKLALAHTEDGARHDLRHVATTAKRDGASWRLSGRKIAVLGGGDADRIIVSARLSGAVRDASGVGLFAIDPKQAGVKIESYGTIDDASAARITLDNVEAPATALLGANENALTHVERAVDLATAAWCAELVGLMESATAATIEYTKIRVQFGRPLAANQVLRHRMSDMSILCEEARSMALRAALYADHADPTTRARAVSGAWSKLSRSARFVAEQAIQLHGGMGVTNELQIGRYLKRVVALDAIVGGYDHHLARHARLSGRLRHAA